jgi:hypothetical protein
MQYVLAFTYQQFVRWCLKQDVDQRNYRYIGTIQHLNGLKFTEDQLIRVPGWELRGAYNQAFLDKLQECLDEEPS